MALIITCYDENITETVDPSDLSITYGADGSTVHPFILCTGPGHLTIVEQKEDGSIIPFYYGMAAYHKINDTDGYWYWTSPRLVYNPEIVIGPITLRDIVAELTKHE